MYDVIGDVHGQGGKLRLLLQRLGYFKAGGRWHRPDGRQAVFVGDLIDRGPEQLEVLRLVREMVDQGAAQVVLGNHEFNAIGFAQCDERGGYLRPRSEKNLKQHAAFLQAVGFDSAEHRAWVDWFRELPMALDLGGIRVVHAWWDDEAVGAMEAVRGGNGRPLSEEVVQRLYSDSAAEAARKVLTCGVEWELPEGTWITDKEGHRHPDARLAVWRHGAERLREIALVPSGCEDAVPDIAIPDEHRLGPVEGAPILFGHHWFSGDVRLESPKVACLDWSAAKDGPLVAYRWEGESELKQPNLVAAGADAKCLEAVA
ncbi:MAG: metallophosphoesterase [Burkholderiaceae bacterium]|jgi:hypothetical protein|nr:metallophosphoesterase [Burkholderiaceae bacterium]